MSFAEIDCSAAAMIENRDPHETAKHSVDGELTPIQPCLLGRRAGSRGPHERISALNDLQWLAKVVAHHNKKRQRGISTV